MEVSLVLLIAAQEIFGAGKQATGAHFLPARACAKFVTISNGVSVIIL
jgi:hypothetical protein